VKDIFLEIPVRIFTKNTSSYEFQVSDFQLTVNGEKRIIESVGFKSVAMNRKPDFLRRHFVFSFHTQEYSRELQQGVSFLVTEILNPGDTVTLLSPVKIYTLKTSASKERLITDIEALLTKDCKIYNKNLEAAKKNLENELKRMRRLFSGGIQDNYMVTSYKMIGRFLTTFPQSFLNFRNRYLLPSPVRYRQVVKHLGHREGERWWLHFQQGEPYGLLARIREINREIDRYCAGNSLYTESFGKYLAQLTQLLQLTGAYPVDEIRGIFLSGNIRFNAVMLSQRNTKSTTGTGTEHELGGILKNLAGETGGRAMLAVNPEAALKEIVQHKDSFYRLRFPFNGKQADKEFLISLNIQNPDKYKLVYKKSLSLEHLESKLTYLSSSGIQLVNISTEKQVIHFSIQGMQFDEKESFGLAKVRVRLFKPSGQQVYQTGNTLRINKKEITISLPIPGKYRGSFKLKIEACDLLANRLAIGEKEIIL
jgi:hypothetical protein